MVVQKKSQISLKLMIDKKNNKVVFVESEGDFVDVLFSLLTLPMGTIIRLLDTQSSIGCLDNLYKSVAKINKNHLQTEECLSMLTHPRSAYETIWRKLKIKIDDSEPVKYYMCPESMCSYDMVSTVKCSRCCCGEWMTEQKDIVDEFDGFVERVTKFIITDDLQIMPVSTTAAAFSLLKELGHCEVNKLEKHPVVLGSNEVLRLLRRALRSNEPFTDVFLRKQEVTKDVKVEYSEISPSIPKTLEPENSKTMISLKLIVSKSKNKILYAEARADFLDFLFSFLTFPLGSVIKHLGGNSSIGCVDNLYKSINNMILSNCIKSVKYTRILLDPKLPQHFNCDAQLLKIGEVAPLQYCHLCLEGRLSSELFPCQDHESQVRLNAINPKSPTRITTSTGGGFMKDDITYMVTDKLNVCTLSPVQAIAHLHNSNVSVDDVEEQVVLLGEVEGLKILQSSLISKGTVLTDVFARK